MSDEHEHHHHESPHAAPETQDSGSQALAAAFHSSFAIVKFVMVLLVLAFLGSGIFQVGPQEKAIILRFGKPVGEGQKALLGQGLHWSFPYPIDEVVKIPIKEIQHVTSTVGWYFTTPEQELSGEEIPAGPSLVPGVDGYVITADRNIIHTRATLYYQVDNPIRYVFDFTSASNIVQNALNNALLYTAAHFNVDDILYYNVGGFQDDVLQRVSDLADSEQLGITINQCVVESEPPRQLQDIFNQVTEARENRNQVLEDAHSEENRITNSADAQAAAILNEALSARSNYVANVQADAKEFSVLLPKYKIDPGLYEQQKLVQVMGNVLTNVRDQIFVPEPLGSGTPEFRLLLNREPPEPKPVSQTEE
jgi:modulator of FtsH protease HflK